MTKEQYEKYSAIKAEIAEIKEFLWWCGKKYKGDLLSRQYETKTITRKKQIRVGRKGNCGGIEDTEIILPKELQEGIIDLIEQYVEKREKEMEAI